MSASGEARSAPVRVAVLGSTGSIGTQTLRVIEHRNALAAEAGRGPEFEVVGLAARTSVGDVAAQAARHPGVRAVAFAGEGVEAAGFSCPVFLGEDAAAELVAECEPEVVVAAIVGVAGLRATLTALEMGADVALANKETLVAAGPVVLAAAERTGARLLPVDSEHAGLWQALHSDARGFRRPPFVCGDEVVGVTLTASGGALRDWALEDLATATPEQALAHPNWDMGAKVTVDTATMVNKALELMEAAHLFGLGADRLDAVVHPQSIVHAVVAYADGSSVAQLAAPDMCAPIQYALTAPERPVGVTPTLSLAEAGRLDFVEMDRDRYPAFFVGRRVIEMGGTAGAVFNAANEAAVEAFLGGRVPFGAIAGLIEGAVEGVGASPIRDLADVLAADAQARERVRADLGTPTA